MGSEMCIRDRNGSDNEMIGRFTQNAGVELFYDDTNVFQTTPQGINVSGVTTTNRLLVSGISTFTGAIDANGNIDLAGQLNVGTAAIDIFTGGAISNTSRTTGVDVAGMLRTFGIDNPFGRKQESEADYLGLIFSSLAGYDIRESVKLWQRMSEKNKGKEPPVFLSTHPSSKKRIKNLENWISEVMIKYPPIKI